VEYTGADEWIGSVRMREKPCRESLSFDLFTRMPEAEVDPLESRMSKKKSKPDQNGGIIGRNPASVKDF
jgi:hypothetical protein